MALILIVDDSPTEVFVMQKALEKHGFKTAAAENGEEGVRKAKEMKPASTPNAASTNPTTRARSPYLSWKRTSITPPRAPVAHPARNARSQGFIDVSRASSSRPSMGGCAARGAWRMRTLFHAACDPSAAHRRHGQGRTPPRMPM